MVGQKGVNLMEDYLEKRKDKRLDKHHSIRFRPLFEKGEGEGEGEGGSWDISNSINISRTGLCFNSSTQFNEGDEIEVRISSYLLASDCEFIGVVVRSLPSEKLKHTFQTAIKITQMDDDHRKAYLGAVEKFRF